MILNKARNYLELRVGLHHVVEVVLLVRRDHFEWFNDSYDGKQRFDELLHLLTTSIVPRQCGAFIEAYWHKKNPKRFPKVDHELIGEKNASKKPAAKKRKRGGKKKEPVVGQAIEEVPVEKQKDVYYSFGDTMTISYRTEDIDIYTGATLVYNPKKSGGFSQLNKLPKRFILRVYPKDDEEEDGFHKPDEIPVASLFRVIPEETTGGGKKKAAKKSKRRKN